MKKWVSMIGIFAFVIMMFAGCSQLNLGQGTIPSDSGEAEGTKETSSQGASSLEDNTLSQQEKDILQYEQKYYSGEFTMEDYHALAKLYAEQGKIRKQRDMLEQSLRLYDDREAFELLQNICVNLEEEDAAIRQQAVLLCQNLETPEYKNEAIHVIESEGWFETLMPKLGEGTRKYFLQKDGQPVISICIGYDENQKSFSNVWFFEDEDKLTLLSYSGGVVQLMETTLKEGSYDGDFSLWILDGTSGSILNEQGTFDGGVYNGEYSLKIYKNKTAGDPFDLWNNRENMKYTAYTAKADEQGQGDLEQFAAKLMLYPDFPAYVVEEESAESSLQQTDSESQPKLQVRIFDGEIQVFQNGIWINMGNVEQYREKDPFYAYANKKEQSSIGQKEDGQTLQESGIDIDHIKLPASSNSSDSKKPSQKPAAPQTPASKPATQKPATQQPSVQQPQAPEPDDSDSDDEDSSAGNDNGGGSGSGDNFGGSSDSGESSGGGSDSDSSGGSDNGGSDSGSDNEADIEWTPDLM